MNQTIEQRRARHAWKVVSELGEDGGAQEYAREAKKLPVRILSSGLGQALVFLAAKSTKKEKVAQISEDLSRWVLEEQKLGKGDLLENIIQGDADFLRRATAESLAYLQWLNRFAEAKGLGEAEEGQ